jgi:integrase
LASTSASFLFDLFIASRRQGISPQSIRFYRICLKPFIDKYPLTSQGIRDFLGTRRCGNGRHAYYRAIRAFCNWAVKEGHMTQNPLARVDVPKVTKRILPSLTSEQVEYVINQAETLRDKAMVSLFADSGMRLSELASVKASQIDWVGDVDSYPNAVTLTLVTPGASLEDVKVSLERTLSDIEHRIKFAGRKTSELEPSLNDLRQKLT